MPRTRSLAWSELKIGIVSVVAILLGDFFCPVAWRFDVFAGGFAASADSAAAGTGEAGTAFDLSRSARNAVEDSTDFRPCR